MNDVLIQVSHLPGHPVFVPFSIRKGDLLCICGGNRSGKTTLGKKLARQLPFTIKEITHIPGVKVKFSAYTADSYAFSYANYYYQQRYNAFDDSTVRTVGTLIGHYPDDPRHTDLIARILPLSILNKRLTEISSGETRKSLLLANLFKEADVYVLDQPFTGLDSDSIAKVSTIFRQLASEGKAIVILDTIVQPSVSPSNVVELGSSFAGSAVTPDLSLVRPSTDVDFEVAFAMRDQDLTAGGRVLARHINWEVLRGEKWLLSGANGSGKSTLMSLVHADNPLAYAMKIILFDHQRGTGESIWDIKKRIGFVSPEIQLYWNHSTSVETILLSGFTGTMYPSRSITSAERARAGEVSRMVGIEVDKHTHFGELSTGTKRLVTIARALMTNPSLLILDEPFQALDEIQFRRMHDLFHQLADPGRTIIQIAHLDREILPGITNRAILTGERLEIATGSP